MSPPHSASAERPSVGLASCTPESSRNGSHPCAFSDAREPKSINGIDRHHDKWTCTSYDCFGSAKPSAILLKNDSPFAGVLKGPAVRSSGIGTLVILTEVRSAAILLLCRPSLTNRPLARGLALRESAFPTTSARCSSS